MPPWIIDKQQPNRAATARATATQPHRHTAAALCSAFDHVWGVQVDVETLTATAMERAGRAICSKRSLMPYGVNHSNGTRQTLRLTTLTTSHISRSPNQPIQPPPSATTSPLPPTASLPRFTFDTMGPKPQENELPNLPWISEDVAAPVYAAIDAIAPVAAPVNAAIDAMRQPQIVCVSVRLCVGNETFHNYLPVAKIKRGLASVLNQMKRLLARKVKFLRGRFECFSGSMVHIIDEEDYAFWTDLFFARKEAFSVVLEVKAL
ncbi:hypothetical protein FN846DRAFT_1024141 [Sphaerosporella brunnea]|uniref:Uncharacterized protein n=1 Tax=Sphaerosporella brunnea TaxID=1250544 RepID=A0A5J5ELP7_9PEZI|nr:hypothetical protein FN846DRAFT_1024141 [Sphaerosporella brunnea]